MSKSMDETLVTASHDVVARLGKYEKEAKAKKALDVAAVFAHLKKRENLFKQGTTSKEILEGLGYTKSLQGRIFRIVHISLAHLIRDIRTEVAKNLIKLGYSQKQVAEAIGIAHRTIGDYLKNVTADQIDIGSPSFQHRIFSNGDLSAAETTFLRPWLAKNRPELVTPEPVGVAVELGPYLLTPDSDAEGASFLVVDGEAAMRRYAEEQVWPLIVDRPLDFQKGVVARSRFKSIALHDFLHEKARKEGRRDRQLGIDLAELARFSLEGSEKYLGELIHEHRVSALAWLAHHHVLAFEFEAAEPLFRECDQILKEQPEAVDSLGASDAYALKGRFRMFQAQHVEAYDLLKTGLEIVEGLGDRRREANILMTIAASYAYAGFPEKAIEAYERTLALPYGPDQDETFFMARMGLANALCRCNRAEEAKAVLARLQSPAHTRPANLWLLKWVEGNVESGLMNDQLAEEKYLEARVGFADVDDLLSCACIDLDYAIVLAHRCSSDAIGVAVRICPVLERYHLMPQTLQCLRVLQEELDKAHLAEIALGKLWSALKQDPVLELRIKKEPGDQS